MVKSDWLWEIPDSFNVIIFPVDVIWYATRGRGNLMEDVPMPPSSVLCLTLTRSISEIYQEICWGTLMFLLLLLPTGEERNQLDHWPLTGRLWQVKPDGAYLPRQESGALLPPPGQLRRQIYQFWFSFWFKLRLIPAIRENGNKGVNWFKTSFVRLWQFRGNVTGLSCEFN